MFVWTSYVPGTSANWPLFKHIFKLSKSDSNFRYDTLRSMYKWKWDFKLRKIMQVQPVSAVNSVDLFPCLSATPLHGYSMGRTLLVTPVDQLNVAGCKILLNMIL